ncbi:MAG: hypothetical protein Q9225_000816 [Loekoesia sp. 1 TL-2023]
MEMLRARWAGPGPELAGTAKWEAKNVEWLLLNIICELDGTPYCKRSPDIQKAYVPIVRSLVSKLPSFFAIDIEQMQKRRRGLPLKKNESMELVREYIACMNELSQIKEISDQKIERLEALAKSWNDFAQTSKLEKNFQVSIGDSLEKKIYWTKRKSDNLPYIMNDLKSSLDVLFQLRTIEQNELAILAESNNKAIMVFTIVTIIFLPLSFFTSYFGMNLKGVIDTDRTERYFWAVCGSVTVCVVSLTVLFGFKNRLYACIWEDREFMKRHIWSSQF